MLCVEVCRLVRSKIGCNNKTAIKLHDAKIEQERTRSLASNPNKRCWSAQALSGQLVQRCDRGPYHVLVGKLLAILFSPTLIRCAVRYQRNLIGRVLFIDRLSNFAVVPKLVTLPSILLRLSVFLLILGQENLSKGVNSY